MKCITNNNPQQKNKQIRLLWYSSGENLVIVVFCRFSPRCLLSWPRILPAWTGSRSIWKMKYWEVYQMYNKGTTHSFKSKRLTCSKTLPRLDLPPLTAQLERHFNKNKRSVRTECVRGAREIIYHGNMLQLTCVLLSDTQSELSAKLRCSSLQTVTHNELV